MHNAPPPCRGSRRRNALATACALALSGMAGAGAATAQEQAPPQSQQTLDEIQVTGTRLQRSGMTTPTPVTAMSNVELRSMAPGNLIDALDQMPQFINNDSPATPGNYATAGGASVLNLRGIGSNRTLILLDGRRVVSSTRLGTTDINLFPEAMIRGVETVTGGASAAYGSDAVTGVVNFLLDTSFTGIEGHLQGGITDLGDNENWEGSLAVGTPIGDRMHFIASYDRHESSRVESYEGRNWFNDWGHVTNPEWQATGEGPQRLTLPNVGPTRYTFGGLIDAPGTPLHRLRFLPDGSPTPFLEGDVAAIGHGTHSQSGGTVNNLRRDATGEGGLMPDVTRDSTFAYLGVDVTDNLELFVQGIRGRNYVNSRHRGPLQFDIWRGTIFRDNPYLPDEINALMEEEGLDSFVFNRIASSADLDQARLTLTNDVTSLTTGFDASLNNWNLRGYYQYGKNKNQFRMHRYTRTDRLHFAMDAVRDPETGAIVCNVSLHNPQDEQLQGCVPINLFGQGRPSQDAMDYVLDPDNDKTINSDITQHFVEFIADGDIHEGWGYGPIALMVGASYRDDRIDQRVFELPGVSTLSTPMNDPDRGIRGIPPGFAGNATVHQFTGAPDIRGGFDVLEIFTESMVPVVDNVDLSLAARWADYSGSGSVWAWKGGIDWQVTDEFRLRATRSRDTRAANLSERFDAQGQGASAEDPEFDNAVFSFAQTIGGNPEVNPELADTTTVGFVYQPNWLDGLSLSVDWFDVKIKDAIDQLGVQRIIDDCHAGSDVLCEQIERDPNTNEIMRVYNVFLNVAQARVSGWDFEAVYDAPINLFGNGGESLRFRTLASHLAENSTTPLGAPTTDIAGGVTRPDWTVTSSATYMNGPFRWFLQHRFINSSMLNATWEEGVDVDINRVASATYVDTRLSYTFDTAAGSSFEVYGHVANLFDRDPPLVASFHEFMGSTHTNQGVFDALGRRYTAGVRFAF